MAKAKTVNVVPAGVRSLVLSVGEDTYEVSTYTSQWAVNQIPSCTLDIAVGVNAYDQTLASIHSQGDALTMRSKAKVILTLEGQRNLSDSWPGGEEVIFEGYVHAIQPLRSTRMVGVRVTLYHWLSDLNTSHFGFGRFAPNTAWSIFQERNLTSGLLENTYLFRGDLDPIGPEEIYDKDVYELFKEALTFSLTDSGDVVFFREVDGHKPEAFHEDCLKALERIENIGCKLTVGGGKQHNPLKEEKVVQIMGSIAHDSAGGSTAWSKLLAFCQLFSIAIYPAVDTAYLGPRMSGATDVEVEIPNVEIDLGSGSGFQASLPRGLVMPGTPNSMFALLGMATGCEGIENGVLGQYVLPPDSGDTNLVGAIETITPPPIFDEMFTIRPIGGDSGSSGQGQPQQQPDSEAVTGVTINSPDCPPTNVYADEWCEAHYWNNVYNNRTQVVDSVLRFDMTPGTIIKVDVSHAAAGSSPVGDIPGYAGNILYGEVETLMYQISALNNQMSTQIMVRCVKSEKDKELYETTKNKNKHPLFEAPFGLSGTLKPLHDTLGK